MIYRQVFVILMITAVFLGIAVPFLLAPVAYYRGLPELHDFVPLAIILAVILTVAGALYYYLERRNNVLAKKNHKI